MEPTIYFYSDLVANGNQVRNPVSGPVIFLDRDGVINEDSPDYIKNRSEFHFIPGSLEAIKIFTQKGFTCIVISNQSMIHRKISTMAHLLDMSEMMLAQINAFGGQILDIFFCPHAPDENCICRKPKTGMLQKASSLYDIDLSKSIMIGDNLKDIQCANNAGCAQAILVRTGKGSQIEPMLKKSPITVDFVGDSLIDVCHWLTVNVPNVYQDAINNKGCAC